MRKLVVSNMVSLDGYMGTSDNSAISLPNGDDAPAFHQYNLEHLKNASTLLAGRKSFEIFESFWPTIVDDPTAPDYMRGVSDFNNKLEKIVVSDSFELSPDSRWFDSTTVIKGEQLEGKVAELKAQEGNDILVFGSLSLWNHLTKLGLVDELHLMVAPVIMGDGIPGFTESAGASFELNAVYPVEDSSFVFMQYRAK